MKTKSLITKIYNEFNGRLDIISIKINVDIDFKNESKKIKTPCDLTVWIHFLNNGDHECFHINIETDLRDKMMVEYIFDRIDCEIKLINKAYSNDSDLSI